MEADLIVLPDSAPLKAQGLSHIERARSLVITNAEELQVADAELARVAALRKAIETGFADPKKKADQAHKAITKLEGELLAQPKEAERIIKVKIGAYRLEEDRRLRIEQARREADERKRAEDAQLEEAIALEEAGDTAAAARVLAEPVMAAVVSIPKAATAHSTMRRGFGFRIVDEAAINRPFLVPGDSLIRQQVNALGLGAAAVVGGIEVFETVSVVNRSR